MNEGESTVTKHDHNNSAIAMNLKLEDAAGFTTDDSTEPPTNVVATSSSTTDQPKKLLISFDETEASDEEEEENDAEEEKQQQQKKADTEITDIKAEGASEVEPVKRHKNPKRTEKRLQQQQQNQANTAETSSVPTSGDSTTTPITNNNDSTKQSETPRNADLLGMDTSKFPKLQSTIVDGALDRIERDKFDTEAWTILLMEITSANEQTQEPNYHLHQIRPFFEEFFKLFPTAGKFWKLYAECEIKAQNHVQAQQIFKNCLLLCPQLDLWKTYLQYIRFGINTPLSVEDQIKAFEFAIQHIGYDLNAAEIWSNYLDLLGLSNV